MPDPELNVPPAFAQRIREALGERGLAWLRDLPALVDELAERWGFTVGRPFDLSFNYVARVRLRDGTDAVFKIGAWEEGVEQEIEALRVYAGEGCCRLLADDSSRQAMLLERLRPGEMLLATAARDDDEATRIGADLMRRLWRPVRDLPDSRPFRPLADWFKAFQRYRATYGQHGPLPPSILEHAESLARQLLGSAPREVLLHGDFHHYNVISSQRAPWLAIDPKGMLGDPGYEIGPFLLNPHGPPKPAALLRRRLNIFSDELEYDWERLRAWAVAHAVLSACWSTEDFGSGWENAAAMAETLIGL